VDKSATGSVNPFWLDFLARSVGCSSTVFECEQPSPTSASGHIEGVGCIERFWRSSNRVHRCPEHMGAVLGHLHGLFCLSDPELS
jgi:hypothetical protein